ncbi:MAG: thioredoxin family protein [Xanthobacteraceae bacterium]
MSILARACLGIVLAAVTATAGSLAAAVPLAAAELIYVREVGCPYCRMWDERIGPIYGKTEEGKALPLREIEKRSAALDAIKLKRPVRYTPTFVLVRDNVELGRIEGYPGEEFFFARLARLIEEALPGRHPPDPPR